MVVRQSGFLTLELIAGIFIATLMTVGLVAWQEVALDDLRGQQVAEHHKQVVDAALKYIKANHATIVASATATTPVRVTVPMLKAAPGNYLDANFATTNAYGQTPCVLILEPFANKLSALVVTEGGRAIEDKDIGYIAGLTGKGGGSVLASAPTVASGAYGAFSTPVAPYNAQNCSGTAVGAGHLANALFFDGEGDLLADYLYRDAVPGHPEANTMSTPLIMGSVQTTGAACTTTGAIARDADGAILSCQGSVWKTQGSAYWKDPVTTFASLPAGDPVGAVRMTTDTGRAFMWTGGGWAALAVDQNGNLTVPGRLTAAGGKVIAWDQVGEGGVLQLVGANGVSMHLESNNGTFRLVNSPWNAQLLSVDQGGNLAATGYMKTNLMVAENSSCAGYPEGAIAQSSTTSGMILSCQSTIWKNAGAAGGTGLSAILKPLANRTISCAVSSAPCTSVVNNATAYAHINASGVPYVRYSQIRNTYDTGYVQGQELTRSAYHIRVIMSLGGVELWNTGCYVYGNDGQTDYYPPARLCGAQWPKT